MYALSNGISLLWRISFDRLADILKVPFTKIKIYDSGCYSVELYRSYFHGLVYGVLNEQLNTVNLKKNKYFTKYLLVGL